MGKTPSTKHDLLDQAREAARGIDETFTVSSFAQSLSDFEAAEGSDARSQILREMLRELVKENRHKIEGLNYPASVRALIHTEFDRIDKECSDNENEAFDFQIFSLRSDFRIACFGRVPVGPQHMEVSSLPGSVLVRGGFFQGARYLRTLLKAGGRSPFYILHLDSNIWPPAFMRAYSADAQRKMFHHIAGCLEMNPNIRGVMSAGWLFDPQLDFATPQLSYLRQGWVENGAGRFFWEKSDATRHMATKNSTHRTKLHEEERYEPEAHMVVWPRKSLIAWSKRQSDRAPA